MVSRSTAFAIVMDPIHLNRPVGGHVREPLQTLTVYGPKVAPEAVGGDHFNMDMLGDTG